MKAAVIGAGKMGLVHASILSTLPTVELIGICDTSSLLRKFLGDFIGRNRVFADIQSLLNLDPELLFVTTPIPSHYSVIKEIFSRKRGINIFVEKTLASNYSDSLKLCEIAKLSNGLNMVGYMKRFGVTFKKAKELLSEDTIGSISSFKAHAFSSDFFGIDTSKKPSNRGGVLSDLGSHIIDMALYLLGDFEVQTIGESNELSSLQDNVSFVVKKDGYIDGIFDISWSREGYHVPEFGLSIQGLNGKLLVNDDFVTLETISGKQQTWYRHNLNDNVGFLLGGPEYYLEDNKFVKSIVNREKIDTDFVSAAKTDRIINEVLKGSAN